MTGDQGQKTGGQIGGLAAKDSEMVDEVSEAKAESVNWQPRSEIDRMKNNNLTKMYSSKEEKDSGRLLGGSGQI